ncbi:MAG TPA: glutamate synthase large subunit [Candidatus Dormibacteraeota bacterium]|nr:glutamate synthase large subunit [Candidatus Dormibacteraeota bacterium]
MQKRQARPSNGLDDERLPAGRHPNWGHPDHDACGTGFIARLAGPPAYDIIQFALNALERLTHRGGVDADGASGDGAGLLTSLPQDFFRARAEQQGIKLPEAFGLGMAFLPATAVAAARAAIEAAADLERVRIIGWRRVPVNTHSLGRRALETMPEIWQFFVEPFHPLRQAAGFERRLAVLRKRAETLLPPACYICSLSSQTVVYKGLLTPWQFPQFYEDLRDTSFATTFAIFHQRYSTNTEPSWHLAQPFRHVAHNGEINTIVSNRRWLRAKEHELRARLSVGSWFRPLEKNVSDSASFDNAFELKLLESCTAEDAMLSLVPPAFEKDALLSRDVRAALSAISQQVEPWDGPAALVFSDGQFVGAKLDRNGLRPLRYTLTHDGLLIAGSETGLIDLHESRIAERQRLGPGEMILAHPATGVFLRWREILKRLAMHHKRASISHRQITNCVGVPASLIEHPKRAAASAGWTEDQFKTLFTSLVHGKEADWSMGDDAPPAFLSTMPRTLWDYCKQRFAQVTNPPIDPLRESHVMSLEVHLKQGVSLSSPLIADAQLSELTAIFGPVQHIDTTFSSALGVPGARHSFAQFAATPMSSGGRPGLLLLSDRAISTDRAGFPILLATAAIWKSMVREGLWDVPLIVESAQVFDTHHVALLVACGASAVLPYLANQFADALEEGGAEHVRTAVTAGLRKVLARMGVSTIASYRNSHLFEIVGLAEDLCAEFFEDAADYPSLKNLDDLFADYLRMHTAAFAGTGPELPDAGLYRFRKGAELHANSPEIVRRLHAHVRAPDARKYSAFEELAEQQGPIFLRDLLETVPGTPVPVEEVESTESILQKFSTQAMSLGSLSPEAHRTLAQAMNILGGRSNTGEGGEDPQTYRFEPASANKIKQVASGRFGVTADYLVHAEELEIKMAQGSKPGEGGQLPARKVTEYIARIRHATPGTPLISPPPHHDIYSIEDLAQLIHDLRAVNPRARIGVKLVSGAGVGIIAAGVAKAGANVITISGHNGGTGSSPLTSIKNTGLPWEIGLRETHDTLVRAGLRSRLSLRVDGGLKFARDIVLAAILGADEFGFGTASVLAIGCVMARQCHLNTCPVGIATQDETLRARFSGKPEMVVAYFRYLADEVRNRLAQLGVRSLSELTGWYDRLGTRSGMDALLVVPISESRRVAPQQTPALQGAALEDSLYFTPGLGLQSESQPIRNSDRSVGTGLSGELMRRAMHGRALSHDISHEITREFHGSAGQSFGAFLAEGVTLRLAGEANDYVGKGLSGGTIAIGAGPAASRRGDVLAGNTVLYGATSGQLYIAGRAGERFAVRNSGALAVVEGVGQHGCEYMTGGVVAILGSLGLNFGSGMTGGLAYVLRAEAEDVLHRDFVALAEIDALEETWLRRILEQHVNFTASPRAARLLSRSGVLPLLRVQPVHFQGTIEATWSPVLAQLNARTFAAAAAHVPQISTVAPIHA